MTVTPVLILLVCSRSSWPRRAPDLLRELLGSFIDGLSMVT
jgi:hypothetical protein